MLENGTKKMFTENKTTNKVAQPFFDIKAYLLTIECTFTLKHVRDMTRTYSQMHSTDK